jgi:preprotein translocase subunit SecD
MPDRRGALVVVSIVAATVLAMAGVVLTNRRGDPPVPTTTVTLRASRRDGGVPDVRAVETVRQALLARLKAAGMPDGTVQTAGSRLTMRVTGQPDRGLLLALAEPGEVRVRRVLASTLDDAPDTAAASGTAGATSASREDVVAKLGTGYEQVARAVATRFEPLVLDATTEPVLAPFGALRPDEVALLPAVIQYAVPTVRCTQLNRRQPGSLSALRQQVAACLGNVKYLLDIAEVDDGDIDKAEATPGGLAEWTVLASFTKDGLGKWTRLTREAMADPARRQIAITLDGEVIFAPEVLAGGTTDLVISGTWRAAGAQAVAAKFTAGALAVRLTVVSIK